MALFVLTRTGTLAPGPAAVAVLMPYLGALVTTQILPAAAEFRAEDACTAWEGWRTQTEFGLSTFFITQSGAAKGGIRHAPTVRHLLLQGREVEGSMALALAMIQGYLAPAAEGDEGGVYRG